MYQLNVVLPVMGWPTRSSKSAMMITVESVRYLAHICEQKREGIVESIPGRRLHVLRALQELGC
jgi:hypothetical protein